MVKALQTGWSGMISLAVILIVAGLSGCGKKGWPEPQIEEDQFWWEQIQHQRYDECLDVRALLGGEAKNLSFVYLQWMELESEEDCPGCPFTPSGRLRLDDSSKAFKRQDEVIRILFCEWEPDISYRWRLVGFNRHRGLKSISSEVFFSR
jgi:hypothetical protein